MKIRFYTLLAVFGMLSLTSCSDIAEDERYIVVDSVVPQRAIIIEDFTGQNCVNCPKAHETIDRLVAQYGDAVIPVSIHAGYFGVAADYTRYTGLMQPEGNTYNDMWGIDEWPKGVVNRSGGPLNYDQWASAVRTELDKPTALDIELSAVCPEGSDEIAIEATFSQSADIEGFLQLWIVEDGIVARQRDIDRGLITDYVHNHVYRASVNGVGGEAIELDAMIHRTVEYTQPLRRTDTETWVTDNLSVVAFVYNSSGVIQAARAKVETN